MSVDFSVIHAAAREYEWYAVGLRSMYYDYDAVVKWLNANCIKRVRFHCALFLFEDGHDATLFTLRWT